MQNMNILTKRIVPFGNKIYYYALDILFPPICVSCSVPIKDQRTYLCSDCFDKITIQTAPTCPACGKRQAGKELCHRTPYTLAASCYYHEPIPQLIQYFKYKKLENIQTILSAILIVHAQKIIPHIESYIISYIPLHPKKEQARGFNQSRILAQTVANYFQIPCMQTLQRIRNTPSQTKQKGSLGRYKNIQDCFSSVDPKNIQGKNIILVDDVSTSGATLREATKILRTYHPHHIVGLVIAKVE